MSENRPTPGAGSGAASAAPADVRIGTVEELAALINAAASVSFFCGAGCAGAREELLALAGLVQAPIAYTLAAKDALEAENPLAVGMVGLFGWGDAAQALKQCDLLVLWGTAFPFRHYLPQHGRVAQVDADPAALGRRAPLCLGVVGDAAAVARRLLPMIEPARSDEHLCRSLARHGRELRRMRAELCLPPQGRVTPAYLTRLVSDMAEPDAVFCIGLGEPLRWGSRFLQARRRQRMHSPAPAGLLIGELVQARRSKEAEPQRQVIALCDDDMRETLTRELPALHHDGLAVKVLLYAHSRPPADDLRHGDLLEMVEQAPATVRRWLAARRASLLAFLVNSE